jgi:hypothetical protein
MMQTFESFINEYTERDLKNDIEKLARMFENKFQPNQKLIDSLWDQIYESGEEGAHVEAHDIFYVDAALRIEIDRFNVVTETACAWPENQTPREKLENTVRWLANNGKNPEDGLNVTSERRYAEIMKKLET